MVERVIVQTQSEYASMNRTFLRYWVPVIIIIAGFSNYNSSFIFKYLAWIGIIWIILAFLPQIIRLLRRNQKREQNNYHRFHRRSFRRRHHNRRHYHR